MIIRDYSPGSDFDCLTQALRDEKIEDDGHRFEQGKTIVVAQDAKILGFITVTVEHGCPYLQHMCVLKSARPEYPGLVFQLSGLFRATCRALKCGLALVGCHNARIQAIIGRKTGTKPYIVTPEGVAYFLMRV